MSRPIYRVAVDAISNADQHLTNARLRYAAGHVYWRELYYKRSRLCRVHVEYLYWLRGYGV